MDWMLVLHGFLGCNFKQEELVVNIGCTMPEKAPFRINNYMSRARFEGMLLSLSYTDIKYVGYFDGFFQTRKIQEA